MPRQQRKQSDDQPDGIEELRQSLESEGINCTDAQVKYLQAELNALVELMLEVHAGQDADSPPQTH